MKELHQYIFFFFSSRRRHTRLQGDWSSDVCSSDLARAARFGLMTLAMIPYRLALVPPVRSLWLRLLGARIGRGAILHDVRFFNLYRRGLGGLSVGKDCFLGDECLVDLAEAVSLEDQVTL